jgi:hypothetical protein
VPLGCGLGVVMNARDVHIRRPISEGEIREVMDRLARQP